MSATPRVSVGMPAYNSAATICSSIESLLAQSFSDFELIVSDNASTDATRDLVESYARRDRRVRLVRQEVNVGVNRNYSHVARRASGELFKWTSSSDWCAPTFLERCVRELDAHGDAVLAVPRTRLFSDTPEMSEDYPRDVEVLDERPSDRLVRLTTTLALNNAMNGVIRMSALKRTPLMGTYIGADVVLMGHLALLGKFRLVDERLFYRRMSEATATALQNRDAVLAYHYPKPGACSLFQNTKQHLGWLRPALSVPMPLRERLPILKYVVKMWYWGRKAWIEDLRGLWYYLARRTS
jgi:glycosyltransferase involved in cell wall biosynthesis